MVEACGSLRNHPDFLGKPMKKTMVSCRCSRVSAERVLVNVPAPMLRCSAPVLVLVHMCFYIHAVGSVLLDGAWLPQPYAPTFRCSTPLHSCQLLKSCTPMLRSSLESAPLHSAAALPLRCSDAPLRSAAQPSAPMLHSI